MLHKFIFDGTRIVLDVHSGSVHVVDEPAWDLLDEYRFVPVPVLAEKYAARYPAGEVEEAVREMARLEAEGLLHSPDPYLESPFPPHDGTLKAICLHLAHACNLRCRYCFAGQGRYQGTEALMPAPVGRAAIDFLIAASRGRRTLEIDFFGGEPLLNAGVMIELVEYGRRRGRESGKEINFTLTTNALLLTDNLIDYLAKEQVSVVLSLDGRQGVHDAMRPTHAGAGSYHAVLENIRKTVARRNGSGYYVRGTFTRKNLDFAADAIHLADLGFRRISVEPVVAFENEEYALSESDLPAIYGEYEKLARELIRRRLEGSPVEFFHFLLDLRGGPCLPKRLSGCGAGSEYLAVTPGGSLYPCHQFAGKSNYRLGSVLEGIKRQDLAATFRRVSLYQKEGCPDCWAKFYCSGGCHANAVSANGTLYKPHRLGCELAKKRLECAIYLKARESGL
ncbi:MAG: thioether cross-link-forming SCIFF peptide maturase [Eubacteriales bacterium]